MAPQNPLPLTETLRDLAILRASNIQLSSLLPSTPNTSTTTSTTTIEDSVRKSYEFVAEARAVMKIIDRGDLDDVRSRVDQIQERLEEVEKGLREPEGN